MKWQSLYFELFGAREKSKLYLPGIVPSKTLSLFLAWGGWGGGRDAFYKFAQVIKKKKLTQHSVVMKAPCV